MNEEYQIRILRYLDGDLSEEEKMQFESELETNAELQKELELFQKLSGSIHNAAREKLKGEVKEILKENESTTVIPVWKWVSGIAAVIAIVAILYPQFQGNQDEIYYEEIETGDTEELYEDSTKLDIDSLKHDTIK